MTGPPSVDQNSGGTCPTASDRYDWLDVTLAMLIRDGYDLFESQVIGGPDWMRTRLWDVSAKATALAPNEARQLVRRLVEDRFALKAHREMRELPVYNLVLARSDGRLGPALKESSAECQAAVKEYFGAVRSGAPTQAPPAAVARCMSSQPGIGMFSMKGTSVGALVNLLPQFVERQVIDRTGLTGIYDLTLKWTPEPVVGTTVLGLPPAPPPPADPNTPDIFTALQEQLGLKLENGRGPVEVIVIDHLEKPVLD